MTKNPHLINSIFKKSVVSIIATTIAAMLGVVFGAGLIASVFGDESNAEMVTLAVRGLKIASLSIVLYGINNAFVNYTQGLHRKRAGDSRVKKSLEVLHQKTRGKTAGNASFAFCRRIGKQCRRLRF